MALAPTAQRISRPAPEDIPRISIARTVGAGLLAGEIAGLVMAVAMMTFFSFFLEKSPFLPLQIIGATVHGPLGDELNVDIAGFGLGLAFHQLVPALMWGIAFSVLVVLARPQRASALLLLGIAIGVLAQIVDVYILLPGLTQALGAPSYWSAEVHPVTSWLFHLVYGLSLSFFPWKYDPSSRRFV